jgi:nitrous oxide reductase accessory protein NosL
MIKQLLIVVLLLSVTTFASSEVKPFKVEKKYFLTYDKNTSCLVRHIKVYKEPKWVAKIEVRGGKTAYFSSPKSMFEFYHRPGKWFDMGVKSERDFSKIVVTDYATMKPINAETAFFVYGSSVTSPAGDDLVAFATREAAEKFSKKYNGKRILKFDEVPDALIRLLNGRI